MLAQIPGFQASIVLLLRVWLAKRTGAQVDVAKELRDVQVVIQFLAEGEAKCALSLPCAVACADVLQVATIWALQGPSRNALNFQ